MNRIGSKVSRRSLRDLAIVGVALLALGLVSGIKAVSDNSGGSPDEGWTFVSIPDFLNADIPADNADWEPALDTVLDRIEQESPDFVLIAGDLVMGHWGNDPENISARGEEIYGAWSERFERRGLTYYPVVGDHEVGDNPWPAEKARAVADYKRAFRNNLEVPSSGPDDEDAVAYAITHKNVRLVALDVFEVEDDAVKVRVTGPQLEWATSALGAGQTDEHLIVAGHVPILNGSRSRGSSRIRMSGGAGTPIWNAISSAGAALYLAGEMHDISAQEKDGVMQVVHGSAPAQVPEFNYLVAQVYSNRIELTLKSMPIRLAGSDATDVDLPVGVPENLPRPILPAGEESAFEVVGTMTARRLPDGDVAYENRRGYFESRYRAFQ